MKNIVLVFCFISFSITTYGQKIKVVEDYNHIDSIRQMLLPCRGKPVFVDLWATWCGACIDEFKFNKHLNNYLKKNNVTRLYISLDKDEQDSIWKTNIKRFKLEGYHIRANITLQNELTTLIWGATGGFSIPHYLMFDKQGKLMRKDVYPPSAPKQLYPQLQSMLN